jgi:hypothetical protein
MGKVCSEFASPALQAGFGSLRELPQGVRLLLLKKGLLMGSFVRHTVETV